MSSEKKRRPIRKLLILVVIAAVIYGVKNAMADKGGSYTPPSA